MMSSTPPKPGPGCRVLDLASALMRLASSRRLDRSAEDGAEDGAFHHGRGYPVWRQAVETSPRRLRRGQQPKNNPPRFARAEPGERFVFAQCASPKYAPMSVNFTHSRNHQEQHGRAVDVLGAFDAQRHHKPRQSAEVHRCHTVRPCGRSQCVTRCDAQRQRRSSMTTR